MQQRIRLGAFDLLHPLGRGGTGVVWLGAHRETGVDVAVKVLDRSVRSSGGTPGLFLNEVRAMAALDHPGIVRIYDAGRIGPPTSARPAELAEGSPYVVMEYASGGTLTSFVPASWEAEIRPLLTGLLSALGHAHAAGVIHRDLKPGNILRSGRDAVRPGWKLTDFGLAAALDQTVERSIAGELIGTLAYMSPEQIEGRWRDYGPWTDLYALGCLMYRLVGTERPFGASKGPALITAHLLDAPAPLVARMAVPADLDAWVSRLVEKDPADRFQSAHEALRALESLGAPVVPDDLRPQPLQSRRGRFDEDTTVDIEGPTELVHGVSGRRGLGDWRTPELQAPPASELHAGLALVGLREPPLVGRAEERDQLWSSLGSVLSRGRAEVVVIRGAQGAGRSRLARWLGQIAHERVGLPSLVGDARHGEDPIEALGRPFRRWLRTVRLEPPQRLERIRALLGTGSGELCAAIDSMMYPSGGRIGPEARYTAARRLVEHLALRSRGAVLVYDDADLAPDLFGFARHLVQAQPLCPAPVLLVLVVGERAQIHEVRDGLAREIALGPLGPDEQARLVRAMIPLDPTLTAGLVERTAGNPMHAVQVVRGWVRTRSLAPRDGVFVLDTPGSPVAPMPEVWRDALRRILTDLPQQARIMLERAATLGSSVEEDDWQRVCDDPKGEWARKGMTRFVPENGMIRAALREHLLAEGLAEDTETGWRFCHELFRETLLTLAASAGRLGSHHRAAARALLYRADSRRVAERIGRHLLAGERPNESIPHLVEAFRQRRRTSGERSALPLLGEIESALLLGNVPEDDIRWAELAVRRAEVFVRLGPAREALRSALDAEHRARIGEWRLLRARAAKARGELHLQQGELKEADTALANAEGLVREGEDPRLLGAIHAARSRCAERLGEPARARGHAVLAAGFLSDAGERQGLAEAWAVLGERALRDGELPEAQRCFERALELQARIGTPLGEAQALSALGRVARALDDLDGARKRLVQAVARYREAGSPEAGPAALALARIELARRDWTEARRLASQVLIEAGPERPPDLNVAISAVLAAAAAALRDWSALELHLEQIEEWSRRTPHDPEVAFCLELAAARLDAAGKDRLGARARATARRLGGGGSPGRG